MGLFKPPSDPGARGRWLTGTQVPRLLQLAQRLLQCSDGRCESSALQRAVMDIGSLASKQSPVCSNAVVGVVEALQAAEATLGRDKAAQHYGFVAFDDTVALYISLLAIRGRDCWRAVAAACGALADALGRAHVCIAGRVRGPVLRQAEELLVTARDQPLAQQLCSCIEDSKQALAAGAAAGEATRVLNACACRV
jgi:hypothetical protein